MQLFLFANVINLIDLHIAHLFVKADNFDRIVIRRKLTYRHIEQLPRDIAEQRRRADRLCRFAGNICILELNSQCTADGEIAIDHKLAAVLENSRSP